MLFGNLLERAYVELEAIVAFKIANVKQRDASTEDRCNPFHKGRHRNTRLRKVHWKQEFLIMMPLRGVLAPPLARMPLETAPHARRAA
jgi:hypothetical protein